MPVSRGEARPTMTDASLPDPKDRIQTYELISDAIAESQHGEYLSSTEKLSAALKTDPRFGARPLSAGIELLPYARISKSRRKNINACCN